MFSTAILIVNITIVAIFLLLYLYQGVYMVVGIFGKSKVIPKSDKLGRFACVIPARNEQNVIDKLIDSIGKQTYPKEYLDIIVIADNCTDDTAKVAENLGAKVYTRTDCEHIGKGYALNYLFDTLKKDGMDTYDGYFVFDADNLIEPEYISRVNDVYQAGYEVVTSYRNSKNFGDNWLSMSYGIYFLREAVLVNAPRMKLGVSAAISGTGFLISAKTIKDMGGWNCVTLTEDLEFNTDYVLSGGKIGYANDAVIYDEQPTKFLQSWKQRLRWSKGFGQVMNKNGLKLGSKVLKRFTFSAFDTLMCIAPAMFVVGLTISFDVISLIVGLAIRDFHAAAMVGIMFGCALGFYLLLFFIIGLILVIKEWDKLRAPWYKKIFAILSYPVFMLTFVPVSIVSTFCKVKWTPIEHTAQVSIDDLNDESK